MTPTQQHLLRLLLEIDDLCKKNDIEYFMDFGTVIGAIRHEGFIPWDNDLDITMTEENYDKFVKACEKDLDKSKRVFLDNRRNREFPLVFGHYFDLESCRLCSNSIFWENYCGQWIDVFCMLELPGEKKKKQEAINRYFAYDEYVNNSFRHYRLKTDPVMKLYNEYRERGEKIGKENMLKELESQIFGKHYDDCDTYICNSARAKGPTSIVPKKPYDTCIRVDFEGYKLPIPGDYVDLLTVYYGDDFDHFPKNPIVHSQMSQSGLPGSVYVADYMRFLDKNELLSERKTYKELSVEEGYLAGNIGKEFSEMHGVKIKLDIEDKIKAEKLDLEKLMKSGNREDGEKLSQLFADYFDKQLHSTTRYWHAHLDIGDELEYAAMYTMLIIKGDLTSMGKLLTVREQNDLPLTPKMQKLADFLQTLRGLKKYMIYKDFDKAREYLNKAKQEFPDCKEVKIREVRFAAESAKSEQDFAECDRLADELLSLYPNNDYGIKAKGDVLWARKEYDEARAYYNLIKDTTTDGLVVLDIRKKEESLL